MEWSECAASGGTQMATTMAERMAVLRYQLPLRMQLPTLSVGSADDTCSLMSTSPPTYSWANRLSPTGPLITFSPTSVRQAANSEIKTPQPPSSHWMWNWPPNCCHGSSIDSCRVQ
eukprot:scaffold28957_cov112-Isochrysis_galbana.AAC.5